MLEHRKFLAFVVSAIIMGLMRRFGMSPEDLSTAYGITVSEAQEMTIDLLLNAVLPGWVGWAWPNDPAVGILDYWRVALTGVAVIVGLAALVWWL